MSRGWARTPQGHLSLPGAAGNFGSAPDEAALDIAGDQTVVTRIKPADWTPATDDVIVGKWQVADQLSWYFALLTAGTLQFVWSEDGSAVKSATSTANLSAQPLDWLYVAPTIDVDNGSLGNDVRFWTGDDGETWTQLGDTVTTAVATSIFNSTSQLEIGAILAGTASPFEGDISHVSIRDGIAAGGEVGGTEVFGFDADADLDGVAPDASSFTASTGQTVTVNTSGAPATSLYPPFPRALITGRRTAAAGRGVA